ncbi:uncharacterized protein DS421_8g238300 [Arachis hypogaea]|nr:uncharacterized protein DS421_8g238300 [Arachis hypogaea]
MSIRPSHRCKIPQDMPSGPPLPRRLSILHLEYSLPLCWAERGELSTTGEIRGGIK